jgi:PAS domain S-box-containing protein
MTNLHPLRACDAPDLAIESQSHESVNRLLEDLRIQQVELEMQAQSLIESQEQAQRQARLYQHLLSEVPVALCRLDHLGQIVSVNRAGEQMLGAASHSLEGKPFYRFGFGELERRRLLEVVYSARELMRHESGHHRLLCQGREALVDIKFSRIPAESGGLVEWIVSLVDQTEFYREHADLQEALAANRDLALVADHSPSMVTICDAQERIMWVNPAFTAMLGHLAARVQGRRLLDLLMGPETDESVVNDARERLSTSGMADRFRLRGYGMAGQALWMDISLVAVRDPAGAIVRCIAIIEDVSEAIKVQSDREVLMRSQAMHAVQFEFLSRMSHNMRTPLNAIMGFSQVMMLANQGLSAGHLQKLGLIRDAGEQMLQMVNQALSLVRLEYQTQAFELESVDIAAIAQEVSQMLLERADEKGVQLHTDLAPQRVHGNAQLLREILSNLISNAIKYSHRGGVVEVACAVVGDQVVLSVSDQGIGIPTEGLTKLFRPFTRLDNGRDMAAGHGLGLAISQQQAELMAGCISVNSELGKGSQFFLRLPVGGGQEQVAAPQPEMPMPLAIGPLHLVYVEDDAANRVLFESVVAMYPELSLTMAETAQQGLRLIRELEPDVVFLDINLPDGNGMDMCRTIRSWHQPGLKLLVALSADVMPEQIAEGQNAGFDHYLPKPLQIERLLALLAETRRASQLAAVPL